MHARSNTERVFILSLVLPLLPPGSAHFVGVVAPVAAPIARVLILGHSNPSGAAGDCCSQHWEPSNCCSEKRQRRPRQKSSNAAASMAAQRSVKHRRRSALHCNPRRRSIATPDELQRPHARFIAAPACFNAAPTRFTAARSELNDPARRSIAASRSAPLQPRALHCSTASGARRVGTPVKHHERVAPDAALQHHEHRRPRRDPQPTGDARPAATCLLQRVSSPVHRGRRRRCSSVKKIERGDSSKVGVRARCEKQRRFDGEEKGIG